MPHSLGYYSVRRPIPSPQHFETHPRSSFSTWIQAWYVFSPVSTCRLGSDYNLLCLFGTQIFLFALQLIPTAVYYLWVYTVTWTALEAGTSTAVRSNSVSGRTAEHRRVEGGMPWKVDIKVVERVEISESSIFNSKYNPTPDPNTNHRPLPLALNPNP